jgi:Tfp pilus assembly protein PilO
MNTGMQKLVLAAAAFLVVFGGLCAAIYSKYNEREKTLAVTAQLRQEIAGYDATIAKRDERRKHKEEIEDVFNELVEILPQASPRQEDKILEDLTSFAAQARLTFKGVVLSKAQPGQQQQPAGAPAGQQKAMNSAFQQTELTVRYEGTFANFMRFLNAVENRPSFLRVDDVSLDPIKTADAAEPRPLGIQVKLSTFHYVVR